MLTTNNFSCHPGAFGETRVFFFFFLKSSAIGWLQLYLVEHLCRRPALIDRSSTCASITARATGAESRDVSPSRSRLQLFTGQMLLWAGPCRLAVSVKAAQVRTRHKHGKGRQFVCVWQLDTEQNTRFYLRFGDKTEFVSLSNRDKLSACSGCVTGHRQSDSRVENQNKFGGGGFCEGFSFTLPLFIANVSVTPKIADLHFFNAN